MTSLQQQLKRLIEPHVSQTLDARKVSLLFDANDAAHLDAHEVLQLALEGLSHLIKINKSFKKYKALLFNKDSVGFNRAMCTAEVNEKLDKILQEYLVEVSPYFLMRPAQQTLEWLVQRHQINNFNMDEWIMSILSFHNSKMFVRVLTILNLRNPTNKWHWLNACAQNGMPLPRVVVVNHCKKDGGFLRSLLATVETFASIAGLANPAINERIDFCFEIIVDVVKGFVDVSQESVAIVLEFLTSGIKSECLAWEAKCYEYLPRLIACVTLTDDKIVHLCRVISRRHSEELLRSVVLSLNFLVMVSESQIPPETFKKFKFSKARLHEIINIAKYFDIIPLLNILKDFDGTGVIKVVLEQLTLSEQTQNPDLDTDDVCDESQERVSASYTERKPEKIVEKRDLSSYDFFQIVALLSTKDQTTRAACLKFLRKSRSKFVSTEHGLLLKKIQKREEEIRQDDEAISRIMQKIFASAETLKDKVEKCLMLVLETLEEQNASVESRLGILKCLQLTDREEVASSLHRLADLIVKESRDSADDKHVPVLKAILCNLSAHQSFAPTLAHLLMQLIKGNNRSLLNLAADSIDNFENSFGVEDNDRLLCGLLSVCLQNRAVVKTRVFRKFSFSSKFVACELNLDAIVDDEDQPKLKKMKMGDRKLDVPKVVFVLEVMELPGDEDDCCKMAQLMMSLLSRLMTETDAEVDYCRRLVLVTLHKIVSSSKNVKAAGINIEVLVQCLRCSSSFQTQQQVLILMAAVAPSLPRELLHNIVSTFTFMGNELFRNDDKYTFEILSSILNVITSSLRQLGGDSAEAQKTMVDMLRIFVDSRHHIPRHRLGMIFQKLLCLDVDEYLWKTVVMIVESCVCKREASNDEATFKQLLTSEHEIASLIASEYPLDCTLLLVIKLIRFLRNALAGNRGLEVVDEGLMKQPRFCRLMLYHLGRVIHTLLDREIFFDRVEESDRIKVLVEETVRLMHEVDDKQRAEDRGTTNERFWPSLMKVVQSIFDKMNNFLPSRLFVDVVQNLISSESKHVVYKGLELLNAHLIAVERRCRARFSQSSLGLVPELVSLLGTNGKGGDCKVELMARQLSFLNLKLMLRIYGEEHSKCFESCLAPLLSSMDAEVTPSIAIVDSALLCFSDFVSVMNVQLLPRVKDVLKSFVGLYGNDEILKSGTSLNCLNKAFLRTILHLGKFFTRHLEEVLTAVGLATKRDVPVESFGQIVQAFATNVETRILVPALGKCYQQLVKEDTKSVQILFVIFKLHCKTLKKDDVALHAESIQSLVGQFLKVRHDGRKLEGSNFEVLDEIFVDSILSLIFLMSKNTFRPMFSSLLSFASVDKKYIITFFRLVESIARTLRNLFGMFSKSLVPLITETLKSTRTSAEACFVNIYKLIGACHVNDVDDSFAVKASEGLYQVVSDMMERSLPDTEEHLIECFVLMARSVKDGDVSKILFEKIFSKLQHKSSEVKLVALRVTKRVAEVMQNVNDVFLQDVSPYIVELVDDDDEAVAKLSREIMVGPLRSILQ